MTQKEFSQEMERKGYQKRKRSGVIYWVGLTALTAGYQGED